MVSLCVDNLSQNLSGFGKHSPLILKGHLRYLSQLCRLRVIYKLG